MIPSIAGSSNPSICAPSRNTRISAANHAKINSKKNWRIQVFSLNNKMDKKKFCGKTLISGIVGE
jgi:hypothetical protein